MKQLPIIFLVVGICFGQVMMQMYRTNEDNASRLKREIENGQEPVPCIMTDWSPWSPPDGIGTSFRVRKIRSPARNGGKECGDLIQYKKV